MDLIANSYPLGNSICGQMLLCLKTFHDQFRLDVNTIANRPGYRTVIGVKAMHPLCGIAMIIC